jgi:hypothetical protein
MSALGQKRTFHCSLEHQVGAVKQRWWYRQAECFSRREIDGKLEFSRLLDWYVAGLGPAQDLSAGADLKNLVRRT